MFACELKCEEEELINVYDMVSFCYDYLMDHVSNEANFIACYILENENTSVSNVNLKKLGHFQDDVRKILRNQEDKGWMFDQCVGKIAKLSEKIENNMKDFGDTELNNATIPFFILMAVNVYIPEKRDIITESGPLNKGYQKNTYVYLNINHDLLQQAAYELDFGDTIESETIRKQLNHLHILKKSELPENAEPLKIVQMRIRDSDLTKKKIVESKKLKIAVIPFSREKMLEFPAITGAAFRVVYNDWHKSNGVNWALRLLEKAIKERANIIIFPEYICDSSIQDEIQKYLRDQTLNNPKKMKNLFLVIAGTAWTADDNNVSVLYRFDGMEFGKQYKCEQFSNLRNENRPMMEGLANPGKESIMVDIDGIGKIMVAICRDISNREGAKRMTEIFKPQFLLVPAWSPSVHKGFREQLKEVVNFNYHTCSVVCNCCESLEIKGFKGFKEENGIAVFPYKEGSVVIGKEKMLCREKNKCTEKCQEGGCLFMVECDFLTESVQKGQLIRKIKHVYLD